MQTYVWPGIAVKTSKEGVAGSTSYATRLPKRVYSEASDQEMDIWIQVSFLLILFKSLLMDNVMVKLQIKVEIEFSLCSLRCPPPTGPGTRRSLWLWLGSRRPAARTIPSTSEELIGFDMISLTIEDVIGFDFGSVFDLSWHFRMFKVIFISSKCMHIQ